MSTKWGILTAGRIAGAFASGIQASKSGTLVATAARDLSRAKGFAGKWGGRAYGDYQTVLDDPEVEAVYIATPHHLHAEWTVAAAKADKAILCEKPFTLDAPEAREALEVVEDQGVFFMEGFMYRCSPQMRKAVDLLREGSIGAIRAISAEFSFDSDPGAGNFRNERELGGGGIMDVGTYCTSFCILVADQAPSRVEYVANLDRGYDSYGTGILEFPCGIVANIASGIHLSMRNGAVVYGEEGSLFIENPWTSPMGSKMVLSRYGKEPVAFELGCASADLYACEADAVDAFRHLRECPYMPIGQTLLNMETLDRVRASCGLAF